MSARSTGDYVIYVQEILMYDCRKGVPFGSLNVFMITLPLENNLIEKMNEISILHIAIFAQIVDCQKVHLCGSHIFRCAERISRSLR